MAYPNHQQVLPYTRNSLGKLRSSTGEPSWCRPTCLDFQTSSACMNIGTRPLCQSLHNTVQLLPQTDAPSGRSEIATSAALTEVCKTSLVVYEVFTPLVYLAVPGTCSERCIRYLHSLGHMRQPSSARHMPRVLHRVPAWYWPPGPTKPRQGLAARAA